GWYPVYVLVVLLLTYLLNQLDRYAIGVTSMYIAQDMHWGDKDCLLNMSYSIAEVGNTSCTINRTLPVAEAEAIGYRVCKYDFNGQGELYQLLAGPVFIVIYTISGIPLGIAADVTSRRNLLAICLLFWSVMTFLTGFSKHYWQLLLLRFGVGIGEAGCTPFATSLIADYFPVNLRASAIGIYNWGIYTGYGISYALGDFVVRANIINQGWRWVYWLASIPGVLIFLLLIFTVKEPARRNEISDSPRFTYCVNTYTCGYLFVALQPFADRTLLMLILAGSVRNAGGYVWAYNTKPYFNKYYPRVVVADFLTWIPLIGGSAGAFFGGFISDRLVGSRGLSARLWVLIMSQAVASPFALLTLLLPPPWAFIALIPSNIIGEMWIGVTLAVIVEVVPSNIRTVAVAIYLFIITNIGGLMPLLIPPIATSTSLRTALILLFPGLYLLSSGLFFIT
ncbi:uncharacterized protein TRIADDRAFT_12709, partial [Trichoplax adhaerens]